jgi:hypothetical protein
MQLRFSLFITKRRFPFRLYIVPCYANEDVVQIVNWFYYNLTLSFVTLLLLYTNTRQTLK